MDTEALSKYITDLLEKIYYLAEASQKRCQLLNDVEDTAIRCKRTLKLCSRIKENCLYFENDLTQEAIKYNIDIKNEQTDSSGFVSDISLDNSIKKTVVNSSIGSTESTGGDERLDCGLTISLKFGDTVKTKNISQVNDLDTTKFWLDLVQYAENYSNSLPNKQNQGKSSTTSKQTESVNKDESDCEDPILHQIKEIFGSDSDIDPPKSDDNSKKNPASLLNNPQSEKIEKIYKDNSKGEQSSNNPQNEKDLLANEECTYSEKEIEHKKDEHEENAEKGKNLPEKSVGVPLDQQTEAKNDEKETEENENESNQPTVKDKKILEENLSERSSQQTEEENDKEVAEVDNKSNEEMVFEKDSGMPAKIVDENCKQTTQSTKNVELSKIVENKVTAGTEKEKQNGNGVEEPYSDSQTIASLEADFASILNEDFYDCDNRQQLPSHGDKLSQTVNSCDSSVDVDTILTAVELAQAVDSELNPVKDTSVSEPEEKSTNVCNLEIAKDTSSVVTTSTADKAESQEASTSRNIDDDNLGSALDNIEEVQSHCVNTDNLDTDLEETQKTTSSNIEEKAEEATQISISVNIGREDEASEDLEATQICTLRNVEEIDSECPEETVTAISEEEKSETEAEASEHPEVSKITISDTQSTMENPSHKSVTITEELNSSRKNEFLSVLGLAKSNVSDQSKVSNSLMDVLIEMSCCEESDGVASEAVHVEKDSESVKELGEFADKDVNDALEYLMKLDSSSESGSVKSYETDSLYSDSDESIQLTTDLFDSNSYDQSGHSSLEQENKDDSSLREKISKKTSPKAVSQINFVPKDCVVNIERVDIDNLLKKNIADENTLSEDFLKKKFCIKDCFVKLEYPRVLRVSSDSEDDIIASSNEDGEIDKLCNLSSLSRKRKELEDIEDLERKKMGRLTRIKRRRRKVNLSGSDTSDLTGFSSVSDNEIADQKGGIFDQEIESDEMVSTALDPNELLTEIVCHTIHCSDSSSSDSDGNEEIKSSAKLRKKTGATKDKNKESKKASWLDDPLLKGSLALPGETKTVRSNVHKRRRKSSGDSNESDSDDRVRKIKKAKQLDPSWNSDESSCPSSSGEEFDPKSYVDYLSKTKTKSLLSDDSDVELIDGAGTQSKDAVISLDSDEERDKKPDKHGRRNILSVLSSGELKRETQEAAKEEEERIMKLQMRDQMRTSQSQVNTEDSLVLDTSSDGYNLTVDPVLSKRLFPHQVDGVKFLWDACYLSVDSLETFEGTGCILAHNMGLGKTFQVFTLVHTLFSHSITNTKHVLIVCPLSTVSGWSKEFKSGMAKASHRTHINIISIQSSHDSDSKFAAVNRWKQKGGVLIIGYEAFQKMTELKKNNMIKGEFLRKALVNPGPDLVVCDEGHLLKNGKALRTKALMEIRTKRRIALTGTPLQNNLTEYYYMVQFVKPNLLGTKHEFIRQFVNPIMNGQYEDSDDADITIMKKRTHVLHRILKNTVQRYEATELQQYIGEMHDYALFIQLHPVQKELYEHYIEMAKARKNPKNVKPFKYFFNDYQLSKYICSHPQLLYTMEKQNAQGKKKVIKEMDTISEEPEVQEAEGIPNDWWKSKCSEEVKTNIEFGTKLQVMMGIIEEAEKIEEKVLIFTSSLVELSSVEYFLKLKGTPSCPSWRPRNDYFRLDGTVPPSVRTQMCDIFNDKKNKKLRVFLMSHKVGGLGLNLVAASRVILLGANFNPSYDTQSIFRVYRFGQEKNVYIYRLLSMGTMEEKIYHRCVTKLAIASRVVDKHQIARHYKNLDLEDLYTVAVDLSLERTIPTKPDDNLLSNVLLKFECIHKYHQHQKLLENRPNEDLNEEDKLKAWEEFKQMNIPIKNQTVTPSHPSNPNAIYLRNNVPNVAELLRAKWAELNRTDSSQVAGAADPLANLDSSPMGELAELVLAAGNPLTTSANTRNESSNNLVPNPAILRVNEEPNSKNKDVPSAKVNSQNVHNSRSVLRPSESRMKTANMRPNPFVLGNVVNRKDNVSTKLGLTPFRKSSSDDFVKPTGPKVPRSNLTLRKNQTPGASGSAKKVSRIFRDTNVSTKNAGPSSSGGSNAVDDDVVIIEDSPEKNSRENGHLGNTKHLKNALLQKLNMNKISVSYWNKTPEKKAASKDEEFVIEIL